MINIPALGSSVLKPNFLKAPNAYYLQDFKKFWEVEKIMPAKKAFGGYTVCFKGCEDTLEKVFGSAPIPPSEMTKKIWAYVKKKGIAGK